MKWNRNKGSKLKEMGVERLAPLIVSGIAIEDYLLRKWGKFCLYKAHKT